VVTLEYISFRSRYAIALSSEQRVMNPKENKRAPKRTTRFIVVNAGSPTRRESHGDGTLIVVSKGTKSFPKEMKEQPSKEGQSIPEIQGCREGKRNFL
jgi:hypothetical protein